ncbi:hypothetical protein Tco_0575059 [Tanacetum coccineum]
MVRFNEGSLLEDALQITPKVVRTLFAVVTNDMFQPWRALTTIINLSLTGKTSGFERPRAPGKKKANPIVIPSVRGGTQQEVLGFGPFKMKILCDIQGEQYYNEYLAKVAKHQRYLAGKEGSNLDSPAPKPAKARKPEATKKSKPSAPKAAPTSEAPSPAKRSKAGKVAKKRKPKSPLQLIDEFVDEGVPENEPRLDNEEANLKKVVEESLKDVHAAHQGPLPPVVIREPESGKFQPLPKVQGKGKKKVGEEQAAQVLLNLPTLKKKSPTDQYIFQRRSSAPTEPLGHDESSSLYAELGLTDSETESDEEVPGIDTRDQDKG